MYFCCAVKVTPVEAEFTLSKIAVLYAAAIEAGRDRNTFVALCPLFSLIPKGMNAV